MRIFLIGPRGAGKTTVGKVLAQLLALPHKDTDSLLLAAAANGSAKSGGAGPTVADIVAREGWSGFRARESQALRRAGAGVIATGGGMVLAPDNRAHMRAHGTVIYLRAPADVLRARLKNARADSRADNAGGLSVLSALAAHRPSLTGKDPLDEIAAVLREREPLYQETAHHVVDAARPARLVAETIARLLRSAS